MLTTTPTPIPVIASFDSHGNVAPIYIRVDGTSLPVLSYSLLREGIDATEFSCIVETNGRSLTLKLSFTPYSRKWLCSYFQS